MYNNGILSIYAGGIKRRFIGNISEKKKLKTYYLSNVKMKVSGLIECKIGGFFQIKNISFNDLLKCEDLRILYNNISEIDSLNVEYACCEMNLYKRKIPSLIEQLKRDKYIVEDLLGYKNVIYVGFIGYGYIDDITIETLNVLESIHLVIIEIKNCIWFGRNLVYYNDWTTIAKINLLFDKLKKIDF